MSKDRKIVNVQFLRAIAALSVVIYHTSAHYFAVGGETSGNIFSYMSQIGYAGVDIFFVISGYIMWITTKRVNGIRGVLNFIYARLTRIYLGYWPFFFFLLLIYYHYSPSSLDKFDLIGSFFLTVSSTSKLLLEVAWTLQYELYFYLSFSLLLLFSREKFFKILLFILIVIVAIQFYGISYLDIYAKNNIDGASSFYLFWFSPFNIEFLLGCFVGYYFEHWRIKNLFFVFFVIFTFLILAIFYQNNYIIGTLADGYYIPQRVIFFGTISMLLLAVLVELNNRNIVILPKFSLLVGGASYSLYLSHNIILLLLSGIGLMSTIKDFGAFQGLLMTFVVLIILLLSILHYKFVEIPLMNFAKKSKDNIEIYLENIFRS